jgi:hypothetical protein
LQREVGTGSVAGQRTRLAIKAPAARPVASMKVLRETVPEGGVTEEAPLWVITSFGSVVSLLDCLVWLLPDKKVLRFLFVGADGAGSLFQ